MKRNLLITLSLFIISTLIIIIYAKTSIKHIDYEKYIENSTYSFYGSEYSTSNDFGSMTYENMYMLYDFFNDEKINSLEDLEKISDYILIVNCKGIPMFKGTGIINNCLIKKVFKGNLKEKEYIKIYDLVVDWRYLTTFYLGGSTPLKKDQDYLVFLKKTTSANVKDSYVFVSPKYGHTFMLKDTKIIENYEQGSLTIKEIANYDFVFSKNTKEEEINNYKIIQSQIKKKYID